MLIDPTIDAYLRATRQVDANEVLGIGPYGFREVSRHCVVQPLRFMEDQWQRYEGGNWVPAYG